MTFSTEIKIQCVVWLQQSKSPIKVQRKFQTTYGRKKEASPSTNMIRKWSKAFEKTGSITKAHKRKTTVDQEKIIQDFQENPKQSLRRASHKLGVSVSSVRNTLKKAGFKVYRPRIVQTLQDGDHEARFEFAKSVLDKLRTNSNFLKMIMFSDIKLQPNKISKTWEHFKTKMVKIGSLYKKLLASRIGTFKKNTLYISTER